MFSTNPLLCGKWADVHWSGCMTSESLTTFSAMYHLCSLSMICSWEMPSWMGVSQGQSPRNLKNSLLCSDFPPWYVRSEQSVTHAFSWAGQDLARKADEPPETIEPLQHLLTLAILSSQQSLLDPASIISVNWLPPFWTLFIQIKLHHPSSACNLNQILLLPLISLL